MPGDKYDKDSFWTLEKLVPKKNTDMTRFSTQSPIVDYIVDDKKDSGSNVVDSQTKLNFPLKNDEEVQARVYVPDVGLVKKITIKSIQEKYDFHANFVKAAKLYFDYYTHECDFVKFYSYMPQYTQFNREQKNYYFYWRYCVSHGKYIKTDYSYFYLYIYEILNLPDLIPPEKGIVLLCEIWKEYRTVLPNINSNMSSWIQDYCMVYNLRVPMNIIGSFVFSSISTSGFFEFYLSGSEMLSDGGVRALLSYLSDYDWRSSRYASGESAEVYTKHFLGAMTEFFKLIFSEGKLISDTTDLSIIERTAFRGALLTSVVKFKITAEYKHLLENTDLRKNVTAAVKYTENKLRSLLSVKSRLAVRELPDVYSQAIDLYFDGLYNETMRRRAEKSKPDYEKLYDAENDAISFSDADTIERSSWNITARLVEDSDDAIEFENDQTNDINQIKPGQNNSDDCFGLSLQHVRYVEALLLQNNDAAKVILNNFKLVDDVVAEEINNAFADNFGDVILEKNDEQYAIIDDYREDVKEWIRKTMN